MGPGVTIDVASGCIRIRICLRSNDGPGRMAGLEIGPVLSETEGSGV